jgi:hypothetical protein
MAGRSTTGEEGERGEGPGDASSVLFLDDVDGRESYFDSQLPAAFGELDVIVVAHGRSPDGVVDGWRRHAGGLPKRWVVVDVGGETRGAVAVDRGANVPGGPAPASTDGINPSHVDTGVVTTADLVGAARVLSEYLEGWSVDGRETLVSVEGVSALVEAFGLRRAFQVLHLLRGHVDSARAVGHFHLDPDAVDERTVRTLGPLFERVVRLDGG